MIIIIKESLLFYRTSDGEQMGKGLDKLGTWPLLVISMVAHLIKLSTCPDPLRDEDNPTL